MSDWMDEMSALRKERDEWKRGAEEQLRVTRNLELELEVAQKFHDVAVKERDDAIARAERAEAEVERLRHHEDGIQTELGRQDAEIITLKSRAEKAEANVARLREALRHMAEQNDLDMHEQDAGAYMRSLARAALAELDGGGT